MCRELIIGWKIKIKGLPPKNFNLQSHKCSIELPLGSQEFYTWCVYMCVVFFKERHLKWGYAPSRVAFKSIKKISRVQQIWQIFRRSIKLYKRRESKKNNTIAKMFSERHQWYIYINIISEWINRFSNKDKIMLVRRGLLLIHSPIQKINFTTLSLIKC